MFWYQTSLLESRMIFPREGTTNNYFRRYNLYILKTSPCKAIREIFACGILNAGKFARGIRNPRLWNPEYCSKNPESH